MSFSKNQHTHSVTTGLNPGGRIPPGYSYLDRSHSLLTPSRRNAPKGMSSPKVASDASFPSSASSSPLSLHRVESLPDISYSKTQHEPRPEPPSHERLTIQLPMSVSERYSIADVVAHLPPNPEYWLPSQVALYLTHVLGLTPRPIVVDVTAYVRNARMGGKTFLRLRERDLIADGLNTKWRKLMIEAVKKLRRDCVRNRIWTNELMEQYNHTYEDDQIPSPTMMQMSHAKGTLKRLRDKKAVREMITNFENISESSLSAEGDEAFVALGSGNLQKRGSISSLRSTSSHGSPRPQMAPIYGEGFVRNRAASFSSLNDEEESASHGVAADGHHRHQAFTREQLEEWFGDLSEQEVNALADELDVQETHVKSSSSSSSIHSRSESGESGPQTPSVVEVTGFDLTPIDAEVVRSIVEVDAEDRSTVPVEPLRRDVIVDEQDELEAMMSALPRPGSGNNGRSNPYRRSTYDADELEALGLDDANATCKFSTARKLPFNRSEDEQWDAKPEGPAQDSVRIRKTADGTEQKDVRNLFAQTASDEQQSESLDDKIAPLAKLGSVSRKTGTFGRAAFAAALQAQGVVTSNSQIDAGAKRAEDESEWGVTFSRKASRRGTLARPEAQAILTSAAASSEVKTTTSELSAASRMSQLFSPIAMSPCASKDGQEEQASEEAQKEGVDCAPSSTEDKVLLPLTTFEPDSDGKKSIRKTSMVLVDRRQFEALAKRMGVLEDQIATLESASASLLPPESDLDGMPVSRNSLDSLFSELETAKKESEDRSKVQDDEADSESEPNEKRWSLGFGMIPSYALGLAAGAGFVLLSEVFGRARR